MSDLPRPIPINFFNVLDPSVRNVVNKILCNNERMAYHPFQAVLSMCFELNLSRQTGGQGEEVLSRHIQTIIDYTIQPYANYHKLQVFFTTNKVTLTETATKNTNTNAKYQTRQDFIVYIGGDNPIPFLICQEKEMFRDLEAAKKQLAENTGMMMESYFGKVPFIVSYIAAGQSIKFFAYIRKGLKGGSEKVEYSPPELEELITFDLTKITDLFRMFKMLLNIVRFFHGCHLHNFFPTCVATTTNKIKGKTYLF